MVPLTESRKSDRELHLNITRPRSGENRVKGRGKNYKTTTAVEGKARLRIIQACMY